MASMSLALKGVPIVSLRTSKSPGCTTANLSRCHRLGLTALQTYGVTRQLARKPENADLLPHLAIMQSLNRLGRRKKRPTRSGSAAAAHTSVAGPVPPRAISLERVLSLPSAW